MSEEINGVYTFLPSNEEQICIASVNLASILEKRQKTISTYAFGLQGLITIN